MKKQKEEALKRLKTLETKGLHPYVRKSLKDSDVVEYSDCIAQFPILYDFREDNNVNPEWIERVKQVEREYGIYVYHIIHSYTSFGELLSLLYVTSSEEEWDMDHYDLQEGYPFSYVINLTDPLCSEFGSIGIKVCCGGVVRTE